MSGLKHSPDHVPIIDALRGIAALGVAMLHFTCNMRDFWLKPISHYGWLGVDVFFVISGFVIPLALTRWDYRPRIDFPTFLAKRLLRLHPAYLATVLLVMLVPGAPIRAGAEVGVESFFLHAFFLNGVSGKPWVVNVFWSLAIEMQYYLLVGLLAPALRKSPRSAVLCMLGFLGLALLPVAKVWIPPHMPLFVFGWLALAKVSRQLATGPFLVGLPVCGAVCAWSLGLPQAAAGAATALLIVYAGKWAASSLSMLGTISYSLYLLHPVVGFALLEVLAANDLRNPFHQTSAVAVALIGSLAAAALWYRVIENPSHKLSARLRYRKNRG